MSAGIEVKGLAEFEKALHEMPNRIAGAALTRSVAAGAAVIRTEARHLAPVHAGPYEEGSGRVPGTLKRSIASRVYRKYRDGVAYSIGWTRNAFYGRFIEFGHAKKGGGTVPAKPFMRPAFDTKIGEAVRVLGERLGAEVLKAFQKARVR